MIHRIHQKGDAASKAYYSACESYRYSLRRSWDAAGPRIAFVMLNPSTATEVQNDPTVERCERRARQLGFGGFEVVNIFAYRATDPRDMRSVTDPTGPGNDAAILAAANGAALTLCAWGTHGGHLERGAKVERLLRAAGHPLHSLGLTRGGHPRHPLYVAYAQHPQAWPGAGAPLT